MQILSANNGAPIKPVFQTKKIGLILALKEKKPPIVNSQCVVYKFECDLCDADYVGYTARHLHQLINEHKYSGFDKTLTPGSAEPLTDPLKKSQGITKM